MSIHSPMVENRLSKWPSLLIIALLCAATISCSSPSNDQADAASAKPAAAPSDKLAIVYYQCDDPFSTAVRAGAEAAAEEFKRELEWHLPNLDPPAEQAERLQQAINDKVAGICLCPVDPVALMDTAELADEAGIPLAVFERPMAQGPKLVTFAGTDHFHCGKVLLEAIVSGKKKNKILVLRHRDGHLGSVQRQQGIETTAKDLEGVTLVISDEELSDANGSAMDAVKEWIEEDDELTAICALTAGDTVTAAEAVKTIEKGSELQVFGFGATSATARMLRDSEIQTIVLEDPYMMGYSAVMALVDHLEGPSDKAPMSDLIVTGEHLVDSETMSSDRNQRLLDTNVRSDFEN